MMKIFILLLVFISLSLTSWYKQEPELTSAPEEEEQYWESFNEWNCFPEKQIDIYCAEIIYDGVDILVPAIDIKLQDHFYSFNLDPSLPMNCLGILEEWRHLLTHQKNICILAAELKSNRGSNSSYWYIHTIETTNGFWKEL